MIDYTTPPNIPEAVIKYADKNYQIPKEVSVDAKKIKYLSIWNDQELYIVYYIYKHCQKKYFSSPRPILYNCQEAYSPSREMKWELNLYMPLYFQSENQPHLCKSSNIEK